MLNFFYIHKTSLSLTLPSAFLLQYIPAPNSDGVENIESEIRDEEDIDFGYELNQDLFVELGSGLFFTLDGNPITVPGYELIAYPGINEGSILFNNINGKLAIYSSDADVDTLTKAKNFLGIGV